MDNQKIVLRIEDDLGVASSDEVMIVSSDLYSNEFKYGGSAGPGTDVCPANAWTNNPDKCQELREKEICKQVKSCGGLVGEAGNICAWCPTSGRAMPYKQAGNKKVPK